MNRNKTASQHNFAMVPSNENPRSKFRMKQTRKMGFNASELIPIMCEEVLPGDVWSHTEHIAARLATPIAPIMDDMQLETWYFFIPNRILSNQSFDAATSGWSNIITGAPDGNPFATPQTVPTISPPGGGGVWSVDIGTVADHFGLPVGDFTAKPEWTAYPFLGYLTIFNEWFRDQNLQAPWNLAITNSTNTAWTGILTTSSVPWDGMPLRVNKRHDIFTSSLPWPQKGSAVSLPLGTTAPIIPGGTEIPIFNYSGGTLAGALNVANASNAPILPNANATGGMQSLRWTTTTGLVADLASATAATINSIRLAVQVQKLLERDARGGSRYAEQLMAHWNVVHPGPLQRPEYLGGSFTDITVNPIAQTATYEADPGPAAAPIGNLGAEMHASGTKRTFRYSAKEHGYIIGVCAVRATPTYQQGTRRHWTARRTRLDFFFPIFSDLGEQAVNTTEIFTPLNLAPGATTWGYQERAAEYRYTPNEITGPLRSTAPQPMDWWHLAEEFAGEPALNETFIADKTQEVLNRALATQTSDNWACQIIMDIQHDSTVARMMPAYSIPGINRF